MYARDGRVSFSAGGNDELCDHAPRLLFLHRKERRAGALAPHALYLSLVSLSPRSLTPDPLQHTPGTLHFACSRGRRTRSSRGLPVGPGPSACVARLQCRDAGGVLCTNRQYVDMIRSFAALAMCWLCLLLLPPALWLHRKTRCGCCWGEAGWAC